MCGFFYEVVDLCKVFVFRVVRRVVWLCKGGEDGVGRVSVWLVLVSSVGLAVVEGFGGARIFLVCIFWLRFIYVFNSLWFGFLRRSFEFREVILIVFDLFLL